METVGYCFNCNAWLPGKRARKGSFSKATWYCAIHGTTLRITAKEIREIERITGQKVPPKED